MPNSVVSFPEQGARDLFTVTVTRSPNGTIGAILQHMPVPVIEAHGADVAERVSIIAGWMLDAAADMERQAEHWARELAGD